MASNNHKKNTFLQQLRQQNECYKQFHKLNPHAFGDARVDSNKKQRIDKTRSKSKKKAQLIPQKVRKSQRLNSEYYCHQMVQQPLWHANKKKIKINCHPQKQLKITQHFSPVKNIQRKRNKQLLFFELEKQPLWHPKRRQKDASFSKISEDITIKQYSQPTKELIKPKSSDPLFEFYSTYQKPKVNCNLIDPQVNEFKQIRQQKPEKLQQIQKQNNSQQLNKKKDIKIQIVVKEQQMKEDSEVEKLMNELIQSQVDQKQIEGWVPGKFYNSMLAIQKLIDDYFIFRSSMRNSSTARVAQVIKYIRDINGYFFSLDILTDMLQINPKLYKIITMEKQKYIKCGKLTQSSIQRRLTSTKIKMKKKSLQQEMAYEC